MSKVNINSSDLPAEYAFHHIGYATQSIEKEKSFFSYLGYVQEADTFVDSIQGVKGCFLAGGGPRIELLENLPGSNTLTPWLNAEIKIYHFAYTVKNIHEAVAWACTHRGRVIVNPVPAVAFGGKLIAFVIFRNKLILEFIELTG